MFIYFCNIGQFLLEYWRMLYWNDIRICLRTLSACHRCLSRCMDLQIQFSAAQKQTALWTEEWPEGKREDEEEYKCAGIEGGEK